MHCEMMREHFEDNGLDWREHTLIEAAVAPEAGEVHFTVGAADTWFGQAILPTPDYGFGAIEGVSVKSVPAMTVADILETVDRVDLIDMDIQGAEGGVIASSVGVLCQKVRRLHIGTHSAEVEAQIRAALSGAGWRPRWDFPCRSEVRTPYGRVSFEDGVQSVILAQPSSLRQPLGTQSRSRQLLDPRDKVALWRGRLPQRQQDLGPRRSRDVHGPLAPPTPSKSFYGSIALIAARSSTQYHSGHVILCSVAFLAFSHHSSPAVFLPEGIHGNMGRFSSPTELPTWA